MPVAKITIILIQSKLSALFHDIYELFTELFPDPSTVSPNTHGGDKQITFPVFCPSPVKRISPKASVGISWMCLLGSHSFSRKMGGLAASSRCCSLR